MKSRLAVLALLLALLPKSWVLAASGGFAISQVSNDDFRKYHPQVNDRGEMTWMGQRIDGWDYSYIQVFRRGTDGTIVELAVEGYRAAGYPVMNARGDIAWQGKAIDTGQYAVFLYEASSGQITRPTDGAPDGTVTYGWPDISDNGEVVWSARWPEAEGYRSGVFLRKTDGTVIKLTESAAGVFGPRINGRGDVIWSGGGTNYYDLWRRDHDTGAITHISDTAHNAEINRNGDIVWVSWSESSGGMDVFLYRETTGTVIQVTNTKCDDYEPLISDNGDIIWTGSVTDCGEYDVFLRKTDGTIRRLTHNPYLWYGYWDKDINAAGDAVFLLWSPETTELFVYDAQSATIVSIDDTTEPEWPQINNVGQVVWQGTNGTGHQVFMTQVMDGDSDGIADAFDACPTQDARGFDADGDGCLDSVTGLSQIIATLSGDVLSPEIANSLATKVAQARQSQDRSVIEAAIRQLNAFINEIEAQAGTKISTDAATMLIAYAENVIRQLSASG